AERGQPEVADLRRILVVEIPVSEQRHVGIAVQRGRRPGREPLVIERRRHGVEGREQVLAAVADPRMRVAVRDGLLAELLRGQRRSGGRAAALPLWPNWARLAAGVSPASVMLAPALTVQASPMSKLELSMSVKTVERGFASVACVALTIT